MSLNEITADRPVLRRLRALGVDVTQLAPEPLPDELWATIANVLDGIWGKSARWYTAAAMYGRFITVLKSGGTTGELAERFSGGKALAPILRQAEMRETVLAANLPGMLNPLLADVVRRTRLTHSEKLAVAVELIDQFHAGLSTGQPAAEIVRRLGEPRSAARRLRREKLKQRSWLWHAFRWTWRIAASLVLLLSVTIACLLYRYYGVHPVDTGDEIERLDALAAAIPVEDRAWPLYAAGFEKLEKLPQQQQQQVQQATAIVTACEAGPQHPAWPGAKEHLAKNRAAVDLFLKAATKPRLGYVRRDAINNGWLQKSNQGNVDQVFAKRPRQQIVLPEISEFRTAKTLLAGSAFAAAAVGDSARALECHATIVRMAQHLWADEEFLIGRLVALGIIDSATSTLNILLAAHGDSWTEDELLRGRESLRSWNQNWQGELLAASRQSSRQNLSDIYSSDGRFTREGFEYLCMIPLSEPQLAWLAAIVQARTPAGMNNKLNIALVGACLVPFVAGREEFLKEFDFFCDLSEADLQREPMGATVSGGYEQRRQAWLASKSTQIKFLPLLFDVCNTWMTATIEGHWKKALERDAVLVAIACHIYHRRHDAWPDSVQALVPEFLEKVPLDPIDGRPLRLVIIRDRPFVYSVGLDHKDATAGTPPEKLKEIDPRDWQLFPPLDPTAGSEPPK